MILLGTVVSVLTEGMWTEYIPSTATAPIGTTHGDVVAVVDNTSIDGVTDLGTAGMDVLAGRKLANMGARGFILETCWLAPQVYMYEVGEELVVVPADRDEFIEMHSGSSNSPGESFDRCISIGLTRRSPASVRESNTPFDSGKEVIPRTREEVKLDSGQYATILGNKFDNMIRFDCWGRSNTEVTALIEWLETFLVKWQFWYEGLGIDKMFYWGAGSDLSPSEASAMSRWSHPFKLRSLDWYVRDEKLYYINQSAIEEIRLRIQTEGSKRRLQYVI